MKLPSARNNLPILAGLLLNLFFGPAEADVPPLPRYQEWLDWAKSDITSGHADFQHFMSSEALEELRANSAERELSSETVASMFDVLERMPDFFAVGMIPLLIDSGELNSPDQLSTGTLRILAADWLRQADVISAEAARAAVRASIELVADQASRRVTCRLPGCSGEVVSWSILTSLPYLEGTPPEQVRGLLERLLTDPTICFGGPTISFGGPKTSRYLMEWAESKYGTPLGDFYETFTVSSITKLIPATAAEEDCYYGCWDFVGPFEVAMKASLRGMPPNQARERLEQLRAAAVAARKPYESAPAESGTDRPWEREHSELLRTWALSQYAGIIASLDAEMQRLAAAE